MPFLALQLLLFLSVLHELLLLYSLVLLASLLSSILLGISLVRQEAGLDRAADPPHTAADTVWQDLHPLVSILSPASPLVRYPLQ